MQRKTSDRNSLDALFVLAYEELRKLASGVRRDYPSATLNPTALVNEAWLKLARSPEFSRMSMTQFKGLAVTAMRQILVDAARRRTAAKRGGRGEVLVFDEARDEVSSSERELLQVHEALAELEQVEPRQAKVVEFRYFGGYSVAEVGELLGISEVTVHRDWRTAKAWLGSRRLLGGSKWIPKG